jgi:hypothetical protein
MNSRPEERKRNDMRRKYIDFLIKEVYPYIDDPQRADIEDRPPGDPPPPAQLTSSGNEDWAEYVRMMCGIIEVFEAQNAEDNRAAGGPGTLSKRGQIAADLVDLLYV